jgi:hypothetical protein
MNKFTFIKEKDPDNKYDNTKVIIELDTESRADLLETFKEFLLACGFSVNGYIDVVEEE